MQLSQEEARVIGSLVEKQLTTPQQYPLTLNALVLACNQASNREPVVDYSEATVSAALSSLKAGGVVRFVHPSHGRSVTRYEQALDERLGLSREQLAVMAVLLLRGPQTVGELRLRTDRMCQFGTTAPVEQELERLVHWPDPLVVRLSRRPGQKEERWAQVLTGVPANATSPGAGASAGSAGVMSSVELSPSGTVPSGTGGTVPLRAEVDALRAEMDELRGAVAHLADQLASLYDELR